MNLNKIADDIAWNLQDVISIIESSKSKDKKIVGDKFETTINMLLDGSEAIREMIVDDLEGIRK